jgi:hypothetical protein
LSDHAVGLDVEGQVGLVHAVDGEQQHVLRVRLVIGGRRSHGAERDGGHPDDTGEPEGAKWTRHRLSPLPLAAPVTRHQCGNAASMQVLRDRLR